MTAAASWLQGEASPRPDAAAHPMQSHVVKIMAASPVFFMSKVLSGPIEAPYNGRFLANPHHMEWDQLVTQHNRVCLLASRNLGKTFFFSEGYAIWRAIYRPGKLTFILSAALEQAQEVLGHIKDEVSTNAHLAWLLPDKRVRKGGIWNKTQVRFSNGSRIVCAGFGTRKRGLHPDCIIVDDGLTDESAYSPTLRRKQNNYFFSAITNMINPDGKIIVVGCVAKQTWVNSAGLRRIGSLDPKEGSRAKSLTPLRALVAGRDKVSATSHFFNNGCVPTVSITLQSGYSLQASHQHPVWVMDAATGMATWRRMPKLKVGDFVAVRCGANNWGKACSLVGRPCQSRHWGCNKLALPRKMTDDLAYFLGLWVAEGSFEKSGRIAISNTDAQIRDWLLGHPFGLTFKANINFGSQQTLRASSLEMLSVMAWLGVTLAGAKGKQVPRCILEGSRQHAIAFLQGLFDGDGNACLYHSGQSKAPSLSVMMGSISEALVDQTQQLLLNIGVPSSKNKRPICKPTARAIAKHPLHILTMTGRSACLFGELVGFRLRRKRAITQQFPAASSLRDFGVPHQADVVSRIRQEKPRSPRNTQRKYPGNIAGLMASERPSYRCMKNVLAWFIAHGARGPATRQLGATLAREDLLWLPIRKIERGRAETVDFVIPGDHTFLSNGIVSHNTPFSAHDLYGELKKNPQYTYRVFPGIKNGEPLFPKRLSAAFLAKKREEIGSLRFAQEIECVPVSDDMSLFPLGLFAGPRVELMHLTLGMPFEFWNDAGVDLFMGVDFALSAEVGADYFVIFVIGVDKYGNRYWVDIQRHKGMPYKQQLSAINAMGRKYEVQLAVLEANQAQRIFGDELIDLTDLPIKKYVTGVEKNSLDKGLPSLRVLLENGKMRIPRGDRRSVEITDMAIEEFHAWTFADGKLVTTGEHDDIVLSSWLADIAVRSGGFSASFGEDETRQAMQGAKDGVLKNAQVPTEVMHAQTKLEEVSEGVVEYDMFGNPIYEDGATVTGEEHV